MKHRFLLSLLAVPAFTLSAQVNPAGYVNVFIGTKKMGHTYPGATVPFGAVQLSPQTNIQTYTKNGKYNNATYEYCAGYQDKDSTIFGFAHTSFSGTGHADLGDILIMPITGTTETLPGEPGSNKGYHSSFSKETEKASPGYYEVELDKYKIKTQLTATEHTGYHKYIFPKGEKAHILMDMTYNIYNYPGKNVWTFIRVENQNTITGYRITTGWARTRTVYFAIQFSQPFAAYGYSNAEQLPYHGFYGKFDMFHNFPEMAGREITAWFDFDTDKTQEVQVKCALSSVSSQNALNNLMVEIPAWDFDAVKKQAEASWNKELAVITLEGGNTDEKTVFYTALYHAFLSPGIYQDVNGQYRGLDNEVHEYSGFTNYTVFSLWDTYRALHPLYNLIQQKRNNDMIKSMLAHQEQSVHHMLPVWSHYGNENWCMIGYHAVSVIADAAVKNVGDFDRKKALNACVQTAGVRYFDGLGYYIDQHYVPEDRNGSSVSKTLEYAYDDWCIKQLALKTGEEKTAATFNDRSFYYKNVYDKRSGYMRPRLSDGSFKKEFDPMDTNGNGFIEGNAWNYGLYVPHQADDMIEMMGGKEKFAAKLDSLFTMQIEDKYIEKNEDITRDGIIGNYVHGNEPGHHIPYLYNHTGQYWKTQERVRMILRTMYGNTRDGLCGNDDAGQMSAWYIFSAMGLYPLCPGSDRYEIGSPSVEKAVINLENKKTLTIRAVGQGPKNVYVQKVILNGNEVKRPYLLHSELMAGGELVFYMGRKPAKKLWSGTDSTTK